MKFDRSNKFEKCYYGQASKYSSKHHWDNIYFAGDGTAIFRHLQEFNIFLLNMF